MSPKKKNNRPRFKKPSAARSKIMRSVKTKNTGPELIVRRTLHALGYRYRLHLKGLPGTPDIAFRKQKKVIFVNGCFWHGHRCKKGSLPKSNVGFWKDKIEKNINRDKRKEEDLIKMKWEVLNLWQCEIEDRVQLKIILCKFLEEEYNG